MDRVDGLGTVSADVPCGNVAVLIEKSFVCTRNHDLPPDDVPLLKLESSVYGLVSGMISSPAYYGQ